jgi:hypothetical protein
VDWNRAARTAGPRAARAENLAFAPQTAYARLMRRLASMFLLAIALAVPAVVMLRAGDAGASVAYEAPYSFEQTYGTALRLIRVDLGCIITEKDPANGYLLFEYTSPESGSRVHRGALEIVRGKDTTHVAVQLPTLPQYHEQMVIDALSKKLTAEHGYPLARPRPGPVADAGADGGE